MSYEEQSKTHQIRADDIGAVELNVNERGGGKDAFLLLHGGAGPQSMFRFADLLARRSGARVLVPTHPGFAGTERPDGLRSPRGLATLYAAFIGGLGETDVTVVGNSMGGWIAAEMGLVPTPGLRRIALVGALGVDVKGYSIPDTSKMRLDELMTLSYHDPGPFRIDPTKLTEAQRAAAVSNRAALNFYAPTSTDSTLGRRLAGVQVPVLVISGDSDRIVGPEYGRGFASAIPGAKFQVLNGTGHVPQVETPGLLLDAVLSFKAATLL